eukprot:CAMPEP_0178939926 /NCGR_PEP_ID=MMETSP0789-20121207/499_1 /TAXON_ID=3005 /ORGANISM="Rhizosolenia setigera, Strain CCMP 1694" /LENGTH=129 /DNA_ID=CAMNT_0020618857 /DNA_START=1203 /DNA_END=1592 /DNA_ORIENTATION=-
MTSLEKLLLRFNGRLRFEVPTTIGHLSQLEELDLYATAMSGTLPTEIGLLQNLERMYLPKAMIGPLPTEMKNLTKLHTLYLPESFSAAGQVPDEVCALTNTSLTNLCQDSVELCPCCVFGSGSSYCGNV